MAMYVVKRNGKTQASSHHDVVAVAMRVDVGESDATVMEQCGRVLQLSDEMAVGRTCVLWWSFSGEFFSKGTMSELNARGAKDIVFCSLSRPVASQLVCPSCISNEFWEPSVAVPSDQWLIGSWTWISQWCRSHGHHQAKFSSDIEARFLCLTAHWPSCFRLEDQATHRSTCVS